MNHILDIRGLRNVTSLQVPGVCPVPPVWTVVDFAMVPPFSRAWMGPDAREPPDWWAARNNGYTIPSSCEGSDLVGRHGYLRDRLARGAWLQPGSPSRHWHSKQATANARGWCRTGALYRECPITAAHCPSGWVRLSASRGSCMSRRPCLDCGTPFTGRGSRCEGCRKQKVRTRQRPTRDPEHRKLHHHHRNQWTQAVATGLVPCARCGIPITGEWDIDHLPTGAWHPSHARCNRQAGNKPL